MFGSIVSYGLAVGAVYALIGITYNVMFSASRVFSFTAGMLGMLGGVLGALFIQKLGMNAVLGFVLVARRVRPLAMRFGRAREFRVRIAVIRLVEEEKETLGRRRRRRSQPERQPSGQRRPAGP